MVSRDDDRYVLYPLYFDVETPRPLRRVPKALAIRNPTSDELARAALELRLKPVLEKGRAHPAVPWAKKGRVLVEARGAKTVIVQQVAERLKSLRTGVTQGPRG